MICRTATRMRRKFVAHPMLIFVYVFLVPSLASAKKVAIIGGGLSGTFTTKYLVDYDKDCTLESVTIFDPLPIGEPTRVRTEADDDWQGSRVASLELDNGVVVELGASIAITDFTLLVEMIEGDPDLNMGKPFNSGDAERDSQLPGGTGIYNGDGIWSMLTTNTPSLLTKLKFGFRYNLDLLRLSRAANKARRLFKIVHDWLDLTHESTFFDSANDMWEAAGMLQLTLVTFDEFLDAIGISKNVPKWKSILPFQGSLRAELLTAMNLVNYNQPNAQLNGLVGLGSFVSTKVDMFSIVGGNYQIIKSALKQAKSNRKDLCQDDAIIKHDPRRITTLVGDLDGIEVFGASGESLGQFDVVVLAAPIQQTRISFLIRSDKDAAVLHDMPLGDRVNPEDVTTHDGHDVLPTPLPPMATRPFTQVVTTVLSNATLQHEYFLLPDDNDLPRSIYMSEDGKAKEHNITAISQLTVDGVYKLFSSDRLSDEVLEKLFGNHYNIEYVKLWGGPHGGATPDYQGEGTTMNYLLYDSAVGLEGAAPGGALYYPNAIETSFACMELSAIGAKSVAKLAARRLGLLEVDGSDHSPGDEL